MRRFLNELYTPLFEADGNGGGGEGGDNNGDNGNEGADDAGKRTVTMTQADLDALIGREKGRAAKKFADYDDLKAERDRLKLADDERAKAALTETERLQAEKDEALKKADEADVNAKAKLEAADKRLIRAEFRLAAKEAGIRADALDDAFTIADKAGITVDDEGNVTGVTDVVDALVKAKPFLAEAPKKPVVIGEPTNHKDDGSKTKEQLLSEAAALARKSGRTEDRVAYATLKAELKK
ncbi:phage scaffolding protein [Paenibacillus agricola]|uniref:Scaffolding protein n=1 Tax=Paenibacillus agricola TaxID=2716264 RepID=A0ABX0JB08_9BACL|nr:scaffolding protein [Paenibacillus agricola]NHN31136.1 scaffolding protein [Paenibacillus agricola]